MKHAWSPVFDAPQHCKTKPKQNKTKGLEKLFFKT
jgi:hypothetical protein